MKNPQRQVTLQSDNTELVCYVDDRPGVKIGNVITLKDSSEPKRRWKIMFVSPQVREKSSIKTKWNNNI